MEHKVSSETRYCITTIVEKANCELYAQQLAEKRQNIGAKLYEDSSGKDIKLQSSWVNQLKIILYDANLFLMKYTSTHFLNL